MKQHSPKFPETKTTSRGIPRFSKKKFPGSFLSIQLFFRNFLNFRLNGLYFGNSTAFEISAALPNFRKFWLSLSVALFWCVVAKQIALPYFKFFLYLA